MRFCHDPLSHLVIDASSCMKLLNTRRDFKLHFRCFVFSCRQFGNLHLPQFGVIRQYWQNVPQHYYLLDTPCSNCTVKNLCLIRMSDTVSDGVTKTLVLNTERAQHDYLSQGIWARCIEYFLCDTGLKLKIVERMCELVSAFGKQKCYSFSKPFSPWKGSKIPPITKFHKLCSYIMPSLCKLVS